MTESIGKEEGIEGKKRSTVSMERPSYKRNCLFRGEEDFSNSQKRMFMKPEPRWEEGKDRLPKEHGYPAAYIITRRRFENPDNKHTKIGRPHRQ